MQQSNLDDVQYGVPALRSGRYLFYNVTWAKELGFENAPQTWDEFRAQACAANAAFKTDTDETNDGYGGLALEVSPNWQTPYAWIRALGGEVFADGAFSFENEANLAALEKLTELRAEGCAWLPTTLSNAEHLAVRKALFITGSLSDLNDQRLAFSEAVSTDQWTLSAFPGEKTVVPVYGPDYGILKSDDAHQLAAWLFVQWLLKPENQARWARQTGLFPVSNAALDLLKSDYAANAQKGAAAKLLPLVVGYPQSPHWGLANKILADGFLYLFQIFPGATPQSVLQQMDATLEELTK
jgi:ABC-type glycerol-3-phosphate transport system substrate-binding protein